MLGLSFILPLSEGEILPMADDEENLERIEWQDLADMATTDLTQLPVGQEVQYGVVEVCPGCARNGVRSSEVFFDHLLNANHPDAHIGGARHADAVLDYCYLDNGVWKSSRP
jgi:hypothetical protein